jgi:hypothetical protein
VSDKKGVDIAHRELCMANEAKRNSFQLCEYRLAIRQSHFRAQYRLFHVCSRLRCGKMGFHKPSEARCLNFIETSNFVDSLQLVLRINIAKYASILQKRTGKCLFNKRYSKQMKQSKTAINKNLSGSDYHLASGTTQKRLFVTGCYCSH